MTRTLLATASLLALLTTGAWADSDRDHRADQDHRSGATISRDADHARYEHTDRRDKGDGHAMNCEARRDGHDNDKPYWRK